MTKVNGWPVWQKDPFTPREISAPDTGPRRSAQRVLDLIDTDDPSWPSIAAVLREFVAAGVDIDEASAAIAIKVGKRRWTAESPDSGAIQATLATGAASIVYYMRRGSLIKIGTTSDPASRFAALRPDEILAAEPGGRSQEAMRHRQFEHLRGASEYFRDAVELRDHIDRIRAMYGAPDPSWPTAATLHRPKAVWRQLPAPSSTESLTAAQAEAELGIKENTVRGWVHRGLLQVAGRDERRRHIFYREHLIVLRDSTCTRQVAHF